MIIKQEVRRLPSRYLDGSPIYPGEWLFTWAKVGALPWSLVSIEPIEARGGN